MAPPGLTEHDEPNDAPSGRGTPAPQEIPTMSLATAAAPTTSTRTKTTTAGPIVEAIAAAAAQIAAAAAQIAEAARINQETTQTAIGLGALLVKITRQLDEILARPAAGPPPAPAPTKPQPPARPAPPAPRGEGSPRRAPEPQQRPAGGNGTPRTGRGLYAWAKDHNAVDDLIEIGKGLRFPARMIEWDADQTADAYATLIEMNQGE